MENKEKEQQNKKKNNEDKKKRSLLLIAIIALILLIMLSLGLLFLNKSENKDELKENEMSYTQLINEIDAGNVEKIKMTVGSTTVKVNLKGQEEAKTVIVPSTQAFIELVQEKIQEGNHIKKKKKKQSVILSIVDTLFSLLPTILMVILFILLFQMQGLGDKGKVYQAEEESVNTTFADVAGLDEEKQEMIEIVNFLKKPDEFYKMGAKIPKGVLLCGEPGTGKTLIAKAIAGEENVTFI